MQHRVFLSVLAVVLIIGVTGCSSLRGGRGKKEPAAQQVTLAQIPEPARAAIERLTAGGSIKKIEKEEEKGRTVYDVEATVGGRDMEFDIAADGALLTSAQTVPFASLPLTVRAAAQQYFGLNAALQASVEVEEGKTFYEVSGKKGRKPITLRLSETGQILEEEKE